MKKKGSPIAWQTGWQIYQLGKSFPPSVHICVRAYGFASRKKPAAFRVFLSLIHAPALLVLAYPFHSPSEDSHPLGSAT